MPFAVCRAARTLCGVLLLGATSVGFAQDRASTHSVSVGTHHALPALHPQSLGPQSLGGPTWQRIRGCQFDRACGPSAFMGVDGRLHCGPGEARWGDARPIPWEVFSQGEYIGPARTAHLPEYRLRVDDQLLFVFRFTHQKSTEPYRLLVGDSLIIESTIDPTLNRGDLTRNAGLEIQPDGSITVPHLGPVAVDGHTVEEVQNKLKELYKQFYREPLDLTVTPLKTNTRLEDLRASVDGRFGNGGQRQISTMTPEGTVQLPAIGSVFAQGLSLDELKQEVEQRYLGLLGPGVEITPVLQSRAPRFVYVVGEVAAPGQYALQQPTTVMAAIALAGGWNNGGNLREVVVFRRTEDWSLMATRLDLRGALLGERPAPADEIWLRDTDIVVVPKSPILRIDDFVELVFTRGIYGVVPFQGISIGFSRLSSI